MDLALTLHRPPRVPTTRVRRQYTGPPSGRGEQPAFQRIVVRRPYDRGMSEARSELMHLIEGLPDDQVNAVLADVKRRTQPAPKTERPWPPTWFGAIDGPSDLSERFDGYLAEGFGRSRS